MHVRIIDANSVGYAQHHANDLMQVGDLQTQAIHGMLWHVRRNLQFDPNIFNVLVWDGRAQWRYDLYPQYKSGRHRTPEQRAARQHYEAQRPLIQKALRYFPVLQLMCPHAEADDVAWGLSRQLSDAGHRVSTFTADEDWLAMVNKRTSWVNARKPKEVVELDGFAKACGYPAPHLVAVIKALTGDASDDIIGLHDVGEKRAAALLAKYQTLDGILRAAEDIFAFTKEPKYFHPLMLPEERERIRINHKLVDLSQGPAIAGESVELTMGEFDELELYEIFVDLRFQQWQDGFAQWERVLSAAPPKADYLSVKRAVSTLANSWA